MCIKRVIEKGGGGGYTYFNFGGEGGGGGGRSCALQDMFNWINSVADKEGMIHLI